MPKGIKAAFIYNPRLSLREGQVYSRAFPYSLWEKYLAEFDELLVTGRPALAEDPKSFEKAFLSSGPRVSFVTLDDITSGFNRLTKSTSIRKQLREVFDKVDVAIIRLPSEVGIIGAEIASQVGLPWVAEVVGCPWDALWNHGTIRGKVWAPIAWLQMKRALETAPNAIYVTDSFLQRRYPTLGRAISCSDVTLDDRQFEGPPRSVDQRATFRIGTIGSLDVRYKGLDTLMAALAELRVDIPNFVLSVVGSGNPEKWLRLASRMNIDTNLEIRGYLPKIEVTRWLDGLDLYVQPSRQEGLPRALLEALSRGCPSIGSTAGGIPELLPANSLHRPGDYRRLAALIRNAHADSDWRLKSSMEGLATSQKYQGNLLDKKKFEFIQSIFSTVPSSNKQALATST